MQAFFLRKISFFSFSCMCVWVQVPMEYRRGHLIIRRWSSSFKSPECWKATLGSLQEQYMCALYSWAISPIPEVASFLMLFSHIFNFSWSSRPSCFSHLPDPFLPNCTLLLPVFSFLLSLSQVFHYPRPPSPHSLKPLSVPLMSPFLVSWPLHEITPIQINMWKVEAGTYRWE